MENNKEKSLKLNAFFNVLKTLTTLLFPLITFPYASRILLADGTGKVNFANSIISYFGIISNLGIGTYAIREAAKIRNNKLLLSKFVKEILIINIISTIIAYALLIISILIIPKFNSYKSLLIVCSSNLLLTTIGISWLYSALEEYLYITIRTILFQILSIILLFCFVKTKNDYIKYAGISVISNAGSNIFNIIHSKKFLIFRNIKNLEIKKHLKPIFILFGSSIAISIFTILDTSMLGFISTDSEVGYYSAASKIIRMIRDLFPAVFTVLFARLSIYKSNDNSEKFINLITNTLNFIFCFSFPIIMGLYILVPNIVTLMCGQNFYPSISCARSMIPLIFISSLSGFLGGQVMISMGKENTYLITVIFAAIIDIILNLVFIPLYKSYGASLATTLTEFFILIIYILILRNLFFKCFKSIYIDILKYIISSLIMGILVYFISHINLENTYILLISTLSGIIIYALCLYIFKSDFFNEFIKLINSKIKH